MAEYLDKLRPDRDLQVYFERPSAIAGMSAADEHSFVVSGTWRQQFDWCVIEWNRDNVWEHPLFRNLPDGDLSGLQLVYDEVRENCIGVDSDLFPTVDWHNLRVWADDASGQEQFYQVPLIRYAMPIEGAYSPAQATFTLDGTVAGGEAVGLAWLGEHHTHVCTATDTLEDVAEAITLSVNSTTIGSKNMLAMRTGRSITLIYVGGVNDTRSTEEDSTTGSNGNRLGAYGHATPGTGVFWEVPAQSFSGGVSPSKWRFTVDFSNLEDRNNVSVPMDRVRKLRWTYAAELQAGEYVRSEFAVSITNWTVSGTNRRYRVAGPGSRRIDCRDPRVEYYGPNWGPYLRGNYSGGLIRWTDRYSDGFAITYRSEQTHELFLGSRLLDQAPAIAFRVDSEPARVFDLRRAGEDRLLRIPLGQYPPGEHTVYVTHNGPSGWRFWFDFLEIAIPSDSVRDLPAMPKLTAATDWDTDHSLAVPAERTAWMLHTLGFRGRVNHYVGALIFYELYKKGHVYASCHIDFLGTPTPSEYTEIQIGTVGDPNSTIAVRHLNLFGDTAATIAKAYELEFNRGYTAIRAEAVGTRLHIYSRKMGLIGETITVAATPATGSFEVLVSSAHLDGAVEGSWTTDLDAPNVINRACRDWSREFYRVCKAYGWDVTAAFSTELEHGDVSVEAGIAQRYADGAPCLLTTPALQTNFSPVSREYWQRVHKQMADILAEVDLVPYMQLGEVQWWYFPGPFAISTGVSLPYYDAYTLASFEARYGFPMRVVPHQYVDPAVYPEEAEHLPRLIGEFCDELIDYVRAFHPNCRYEVLYPTDVNDTPWGRVVNYPADSWTPGKLDVLKTESFSFTFERNLNKSRYSVEYPSSRGFSASKSAYLVGPGDSTTTWKKEVKMAYARGVESIVLFALDQFCLIGYDMPLFRGEPRSARYGS
jgi:hypothetical protein